MKRLALITLALLTLNATTAQAETYTIDPSHTHVTFGIDHMGTSTNHGSFNNITGQVNYNPSAKTGFVAITIPITSLNTGMDKFDEHLKSPDFFNVAKYPTAYFKSKKWYFNGDKPSKIDGELTLLGQTHPVTLIASKFNCYESLILKAHVCGGDFKTTFDRTQWGMMRYANIANMKNVSLMVQVEAYKK